MTLVYSDGTESDPIYTKVVGQAKSENNYTTGLLYFDRMNRAVGTQVRDWRSFKPYTTASTYADAKAVYNLYTNAIKIAGVEAALDTSRNNKDKRFHMEFCKA